MNDEPSKFDQIIYQQPSKWTYFGELVNVVSNNKRGEVSSECIQTVSVDSDFIRIIIEFARNDTQNIHNVWPIYQHMLQRNIA